MQERIEKPGRNLLLLTLWAAIAATLAGCPSAPVNTGPGPTNGNTPTSTPSAPPQSPSSAVSDSTPGSLATPTDAYRTAHGLRANKDIEGLKRVLSKDILEFFTEMGKLDKKSLDEMLLELCLKPQAATPESRNEKITGNRAIIEYQDENGEWKEMDFEKEGSEWKLTLPKAEEAAVPPKKP